MPKPEEILQSIEDFLKTDIGKLEKFHTLISQIQKDTTNVDEIYDEIISLIKDNEEVYNAFIEGFALLDDGDPITQLASFIDVVTTNIQDCTESDLFSQFTRVLSLFTNGLVPLQFFKSTINKFRLPSRNRVTIKKELKKLVQKIESNDEQQFIRTIRQHFMGGIGDDFCISLDYTPSVLVQILVMVGFSCNQNEIQTILSALKLYSSSFISVDDAYDRIEPINKKIGHTFENFAQKESSEKFYPHSIFQSMKSDFSEKQLKWVLGDTLYNILNNEKVIGETPPSLIETAVYVKNEDRKLKDRNEPAALPYIAELQSTTMFKILSIMCNFYRSDNFFQKPQIPSKYLDLIFGPGKFEQNEENYSLLIETCLKFGKKTNRAESYFLDQRLESYSPSSSDWRVAFHQKIQTKSLLHTLFFTGQEFDLNNSEILKVAKKIITQFASRIPSFEIGIIDAFYQMLTDGKYHINPEAAMAFSIFIEILKMIQSTDSETKNSEDFQKLGEMVWQETPPLSRFTGFSIANIDLALKYFIRNLNKAYKENKQQFTTSCFPCSGIAFQISISNNTFSIKGYINPLFD